MSLRYPHAADGMYAAHPEGEAQSADVSALFRRFGISEEIRVLLTQDTYAFAENPEDNWLYAAFAAFQRLNKKRTDQGKSTRTFASIGTGPGLDVIGASHIFTPTHLIGTDVDPSVLPIARHNILANVHRAMAVTTAAGDLCEPLRTRDILVDIAYGNLPLLPSDAHDRGGAMHSSTFMSHELFEAAPTIYKKYRLAMIHVFLQDVRQSLNTDGCVAINLGGRIPVELIRRLFEECRYTYSELFTMLKIQSQPDEVLPAFSAAEQEGNVQFDFYSIENALRHVPSEPASGTSAEEYKAALAPFRINATEALKLHECGGAIGHVVQMIEGQPC